MPGFDGTGPQGFGSMTGGGRGFCVSQRPAGVNYGRGRGGGRGLGRGRGWRAGFLGRGMSTAQPVTNEQEISILKNEAAMLKSDLKNVEEQISALEKNTGAGAQ